MSEVMMKDPTTSSWSGGDGSTTCEGDPASGLVMSRSAMSTRPGAWWPPSPTPDEPETYRPRRLGDLMGADGRGLS